MIIKSNRNKPLKKSPTNSKMEKNLSKITEDELYKILYYLPVSSINNLLDTLPTLYVLDTDKTLTTIRKVIKEKMKQIYSENQKKIDSLIEEINLCNPNILGLKKKLL